MFNGLTKEWFQLLIKQIFDAEYGMFVYHTHSRCYWFSMIQEGNLRCARIEPKHWCLDWSRSPTV